MARNESYIGAGLSYATIALWESNTDNDLTIDTDIEVGVLSGGVYDESNLIMAGATTNANAFRMLTTSAAPPSGSPNSSARIKHDDSGQHTFQVQEGNFHFFGIEIRSGPGSSDECIRVDIDGQPIILSACLLYQHQDQGGTEGDALYFNGANVDVSTINCGFYGFTRSVWHDNYSDINVSSHYDTVFCNGTNIAISNSRGEYDFVGGIYRSTGANFNGDPGNGGGSVNASSCFFSYAVGSTGVGFDSSANVTENAAIGTETDGTHDVIITASATGEGWNLRLVDDTDNDAIKYISTTAHKDLVDKDGVGNSRDSAQNYDAGFHALTQAAAGTDVDPNAISMPLHASPLNAIDRLERIDSMDLPLKGASLDAIDRLENVESKSMPLVAMAPDEVIADTGTTVDVAAIDIPFNAFAGTKDKALDIDAAEVPLMGQAAASGLDFVTEVDAVEIPLVAQGQDDIAADKLAEPDAVEMPLVVGAAPRRDVEVEPLPAQIRLVAGLSTSATTSDYTVELSAVEIPLTAFTGTEDKALNIEAVEMPMQSQAARHDVEVELGAVEMPMFSRAPSVEQDVHPASVEMPLIASQHVNEIDGLSQVTSQPAAVEMPLVAVAPDAIVANVELEIDAVDIPMAMGTPTKDKALNVEAVDMPVAAYSTKVEQAVNLGSAEIPLIASIATSSLLEDNTPAAVQLRLIASPLDEIEADVLYEIAAANVPLITQSPAEVAAVIPDKIPDNPGRMRITLTESECTGHTVKIRHGRRPKRGVIIRDGC